MNDFSHLDEQGNVRMVDITPKVPTVRVAIAEGKITLSPETISAISNNSLPKGNVLTTAKIAGIQAAKRTPDLIPLCHQLSLSWVDVEFDPGNDYIGIRAIVKTKEATGIEMEALTAVSVAALTIYDMCKAVDKTITIGEIRLTEKIGGKSTHVTDYKPQVGVIVLSDSIAAGKGQDKSGLILKAGFARVGCTVDHYLVVPDGSDNFKSIIQKWIGEGVELIVTSGGTGLGPRDLTIDTVVSMLDRRLPGVEQALHAYGRGVVKTAMLSRLLAGTVGQAIIICLPGSTGAAKDALNVLIPAIFHAFHMMKGEKH